MKCIGEVMRRSVGRRAVPYVLFALAGGFQNTVVTGQVFNGVTFPAGAASFADEVIVSDP
jgi:hypothetical protein